ncbi:MAG: hypothetical protein J07HB67_00041 [halophilic archaeon J07HB67]|nr:MAG: hypothetical protein J07HB67_00041 [halophilic archaeon J07HB67]
MSRRVVTGIVAAWASRAAAHTGHGTVHTVGGWGSVTLLGLAGVAVLWGVGRLYTSDAVSVVGAGVGATVGLACLVAAGLLVLPVV